MIIKEKRIIICDICGKKFAFKDTIFGFKFIETFFDKSYPRHMCESCLDEFKKIIKERKVNNTNK